MLSKRRPKRVVIVDDSRTMQALLEQIMSIRLGFEIVGLASDGASAMSMIEQLQPDLVTIDLHMPYIDGQELLLKLTDVPALHKVVISANAENLTVRSALERLGADAILSKDGISLDPAEFCKSLVAIVSKPKMVGARTTAGKQMDDAYAMPIKASGAVAMLRAIRGFPVPADEQRRLRILNELDLANDKIDRRLDLLTEHLAATTSFSACSMTFIDRHTQWIKSGYGIDRGPGARSQAFCSYTICGDEPLVIRDATLDGRFSQLECVTSGPMIRAYVGCPIIDSSGVRLGSVCLIDTKPRQVTAAELINLQSIARIAAGMIEATSVGARHAA